MVCIKFEKFASLCVVNVMCLSKPCTFEWQNLEQTDQWLALQKSIFLCDYLTKSDGVFTECREIVIFSYLEIILWFTHHFESYLCGKSDCNFFWDIWYNYKGQCETSQFFWGSSMSKTLSYFNIIYLGKVRWIISILI